MAFPAIGAAAASTGLPGFIGNVGSGLVGQGSLGSLLNPNAALMNQLPGSAGNMSTLQALMMAGGGGGIQAQFGNNQVSIGGGGGGIGQNMLMSQLLNSGQFAPPQNPNKGMTTMTDMNTGETQDMRIGLPDFQQSQLLPTMALDGLSQLQGPPPQLANLLPPGLSGQGGFLPPGIPGPLGL